MMNPAFIFSLSFLLALSLKQVPLRGQTPALVKAWETAPEFSIPESVCWDSSGITLYVSNINGKPTEKDGNGFISKISSEGKVIDKEWVTGLNAPKGMGICGKSLFVTDIDRVAEIDLLSGKILHFYEAPGAGFLNDIAVGPEGDVYVSDMAGTTIYRISQQKLTTWLSDPLLTNPNGLFVEGQFLMIGCKKIVRVPLAGDKPGLWLDGTGSIDGLEGTGDGRFLFSDWTGNVYLVNERQEIVRLLDLTGEKKNAADIEYIPSKKLLLVPTFSANTVIAYILSN